jgi:hypothetical protein
MTIEDFNRTFTLYDDLKDLYTINDRVYTGYSDHLLWNDCTVVEDAYITRRILISLQRVKIRGERLGDDRLYNDLRNKVRSKLNTPRGEEIIRFMKGIEEYKNGKPSYEYTGADLEYIIEHYDLYNIRQSNGECPICCCDGCNVMTGYYNCTHQICGTCFEGWKAKTCPMCRASTY